MSERLNSTRVAAILDRIADLRVVIVGDLFLDVYLIGKAERLSREGPVPVLALRERACMPGGAANPARNIAALGAKAIQIGLIGRDESGVELRALLESAGIDVRSTVEDPLRPTTLKTRVVAEGPSAPHQVARIDRQLREAVSGRAEAELIEALEARSAASDAIILSHYRSGVVTPSICSAARSAGSEHGIWLTADAQGDLDRFKGFDLVRIGRQDAAAELGTEAADATALESLCLDLLERLDAKAVMIGRGAEGMSIAGRDEGYYELRPANLSQVYDVTGAGDTVIALVTAALAAGAELREATMLANVAAGYVVRQLGVAAPTRQDILAELEPEGG